jgi:sarcosine oxidase subunit gamma
MSVGPAMTSEGPVRLTLLPEAARFSLRAREGDLAAAASAFGAALPARIGQTASAGPRSALCLGPDEWVLHTVADDAEALQHAFAAIAGAAPHSLTDISDRERAISVSGPQAADLLSTSCPRDPTAIPVGEGTRTIFDTVPMVMVREAEDSYRIEVWCSYLPHVWALLQAANRELASGL